MCVCQDQGRPALVRAPSGNCLACGMRPDRTGALKRVKASRQDDIDAEVTRAEDAIEAGQARWAETGSSRR